MRCAMVDSGDPLLAIGRAQNLEGDPRKDQHDEENHSHDATMPDDGWVEGIAISNQLDHS